MAYLDVGILETMLHHIFFAVGDQTIMSQITVVVQGDILLSKRHAVSYNACL